MSKSKIEVSIGRDTYDISRNDVKQAFENTKKPYDSHSARVYFDGEGKGLKDVFRNIEQIPGDTGRNTVWMERKFNKLGFETGRAEDNGEERSHLEKEILELWEEIAREHAEGENFSFERDVYDVDKPVNDFIENPTEENFEEFWSLLHSADMQGSATVIYKKWEGTDKELANLIEEILEADEYNEEWEDKLGAVNTLRELFGHLHTSEYPVINSCAEEGLDFFGYDTPGGYSDIVSEFEEFKKEYEDAVGHATADTDHQVPINYEIDQLFNVIDKADEDDIAEAETEEVEKLHKMVVGTEPDSDYYWVNQSKDEEIKEGFLRAPVDNEPSHDLSILEDGDIIFHYKEQRIVGYSEVVSEAEKSQEDDGEYYVVDVDFHEYDEKLSLDQVKGYLTKDDVRLERYYPLDSYGGVNSGYLFRLSDAAGKWIMGVDKSRLLDLIDSPDFSLEGRPDGLYFEDWGNIRNQIEASLNSRKNIILNGPPGTGKTKIAKWVCEQVAEEEEKVDGYEFTTATADWTAFDTIGGYVPSTEENDEELQFEPRIFLNRFRDDEDEVRNEWLLIDEINRSDIDKAFGQLFSVLSEDSVTLPYERDDTVELVWTDDEETAQRIENNPDKFPVTESWRLLATMNTHDKASLYEMSYAFMRRFNFIHIGVPDVEERLLDPDLDEEDNFSSKWIDEGISEDTIKESYEDVTKVWEKVNEQKEIGPSIVRDIFSYLDQYPEDEDDERALTNAVVSLVFPQMEGMRRDEQVGLVDSLSDIDSIDDEILTDTAEDIFRRDFSQDDQDTA